jgi:NADPH-dependent glutamate synthase beta subunit-like oxidoreductase
MKLIHPQQLEKLPPCRANCPSGTDIRGWIAIISQRDKLGLDKEQAYLQAWQHLVDFNPLPSVLGRVCPHTCEMHCNRIDKDQQVTIHAMERFLGDWALEKQLPLPVRERTDNPQSIGVIGSGPAGLSFAYQMARRGHDVTIYEQHDNTGGMLRYGIPRYRLPREILDGEVRRITDLGVTILTGIRVGRDIEVTELKQRHSALFVGIGADHPRQLEIPGENGPGVLAGTQFMYRINQRHHLDPGHDVIVVGGGNTAIDSARAARRLGTKVTLLYRRTREEMPAVDEEVEEALAEGIDIHFLAAPAAILRDGDRITAVHVQRMVPGEPDASGRRRPVPVEGDGYDLPASTIIAAVSQYPEWGNLEALKPTPGQVKVDACGQMAVDTWTGGDTLGLGTVSRAIGHGRIAAQAALAEHCKDSAGLDPSSPVSRETMHLDYYDSRPPVKESVRPSDEWLSKPDDEVHQSISEEQFLQEVTRCLSCGCCFGCEQCWMFCNPGAYVRNENGRPGAYFTFNESLCEGCGKCIDVCPCGYLSPAGS